MPRHALRRASERGSGDSPQAQLSLANVMKGVRLEVEAAAKRRCAVKGASLARKTKFLYLKNLIPDDVVCTGCFCAAQANLINVIITFAIHTPRNGLLFLPLLESIIGWRVVRLRQEFYVDIFFSETGEWTESANVVCGLRNYFDIVTPGVACNGKLYFSGSDDESSYILELDPFQGISNISASNGDGDDDHIIVDKCRFSLAPLDMSSEVRGNSLAMDRVLGACRGHLRVTEFVLGNHLSVWELDADDDNLKWRLVVDKVPFFELDSSYYDDVSSTPLDECAKTAIGFHPTIEDTIYVDAMKIIRWNFGAGMFEFVPEIRSRDTSWNLNYIHPFVLPWWPTPVPSL
ncbi:PREDICTED: uncharacterized protein LOC103337164 [Prunus mume]|uniref:Uncharacterized protein LOC103337164 n=1 Tax=Prunus mume TaxID=102107 RepID=A0ABM1LUG3_PRUMU|nr:PREDICTED: uncharacterized protein LOC103337164 [Prunus mume]